MMDGSLLEDGKTPSTYEYNVKVTREVVEAAHAVGVTVEGEIGTLGGIEDGHGSGGTGLEHVTNPTQAEQFVADTGVDALAVAIGTSHGVHKFKLPPTGDVLKMDIIEDIHRRLPNCHIVMHGSSSVPQELLNIIRMHRGFMPETYGVPIEQIQQGIKHGVRKINVDTDSRLAMTGAVRRAFDADPDKFDPRDWLTPARDAMKKVCIARMVAFGSAGNAGKIKPCTCAEMVDFYVRK
jgi:fructose-bisphosphate aldolase class II